MGTSLMFGQRKLRRSVIQRAIDLNWWMVFTLICLGGIGVGMLYSVAGGSFDPWSSQQAVRIAIALVIMIFVALVDLRWWMALAYPAYVIGLLLLVSVELFGVSGMGGQRWIDIGFMRLQPSELMKVAIILALARYFHGLSLYDTRKFSSLLIPIVMIIAPAILVIRQPDLGTTILMVLGGLAVIFLAGARIWLFVAGMIASIAALPIGWQFLKDYQKNRVLTFLNPESDPLGAGYQIMQSKIALGSGGVWGKGFLQGTQSQLNFLPEMKTDFIFTVLAEEFGMVGGAILLSLYLILLTYGLWVSMTCRSQFGRLVAMGLSWVLFLYVFVNIAMVMGLLPVVGVPLPLISHGGSAILTVMVLYGLILSVSLNRQLSIPRKDAFG